MSEYTIYNRGDFKVIEVDMKEAVYQGKKWTSLSEFQKRKYENLVFIRNNTGQPIKFIYQ